MTEKNVLWTGMDVVRAVKGKASPVLSALSFSGIAIDSREVQQGDLFVALSGKTEEGHAYIKQALEKGAVGAMGSYVPPGCDSDQMILVPHSGEGLKELAAAARERCGGHLIGVTGSVGKTGVKEALNHLLSFQGTTVASPKSYNNQVGVAYSLAYLQKETQFGVFELGMNHKNEISPLSSLVRPHCVIITTIGEAHLGNFKHLDEIAAAKAEIFDGLEEGGTAVLNKDNSYGEYLQERALEKGAGRVITFGEHPHSHVRLLGLKATAQGSHLTVDFQGKRIEYEVPLAGKHHGLNSLAVLAAISAVGGDGIKAAADFITLSPGAGRGARYKVPLGEGHILLIDETYNANPVSMKGALEVLKEIIPEKGGRRVAVLGDMLELGSHSQALHEALAAPIASSPIDTVITCGPMMANLHDKIPASQRGIHGEESQSLGEEMKAWVRPGDVVMVKGSRGMKMERVLQALGKPTP